MDDTGVAALWQALRRRKVVQWGLAYAAGAWALLQVISHVVVTFHWPEQIQQLAPLLLLLGLPVALSFRRKDLISNDRPNYAGDLGLGPNPKLVAPELVRPWRRPREPRRPSTR